MEKQSKTDSNPKKSALFAQIKELEHKQEKGNK